MIDNEDGLEVQNFIDSNIELDEYDDASDYDNENKIAKPKRTNST